MAPVKRKSSDKTRRSPSVGHVTENSSPTKLDNEDDEDVNSSGEKDTAPLVIQAKKKSKGNIKLGLPVKITRQEHIRDQNLAGGASASAPSLSSTKQPDHISPESIPTSGTAPRLTWSTGARVANAPSFTYYRAIPHRSSVSKHTSTKTKKDPSLLPVSTNNDTHPDLSLSLPLPLTGPRVSVSTEGHQRPGSFSIEDVFHGNHMFGRGSVSSSSPYPPFYSNNSGMMYPLPLRRTPSLPYTPVSRRISSSVSNDDAKVSDMNSGGKSNSLRLRQPSLMQWPTNEGPSSSQHMSPFLFYYPPGSLPAPPNQLQSRSGSSTKPSPRPSVDASTPRRRSLRLLNLEGGEKDSHVMDGVDHANVTSRNNSRASVTSSVNVIETSSRASSASARASVNSNSYPSRRTRSQTRSQTRSRSRRGQSQESTSLPTPATVSPFRWRSSSAPPGRESTPPRSSPLTGQRSRGPRNDSLYQWPVAAAGISRRRQSSVTSTSSLLSNTGATTTTPTEQRPSQKHRQDSTSDLFIIPAHQRHYPYPYRYLYQHDDINSNNNNNIQDLRRRRTSSMSSMSNAAYYYPFNPRASGAFMHFYDMPPATFFDPTATRPGSSSISIGGGRANSFSTGEGKWTSNASGGSGGARVSFSLPSDIAGSRLPTNQPYPHHPYSPRMSIGVPGDDDPYRKISASGFMMPPRFADGGFNHFPYPSDGSGRLSAPGSASAAASVAAIINNAIAFSGGNNKAYSAKEKTEAGAKVQGGVVGAGPKAKKNAKGSRDDKEAEAATKEDDGERNDKDEKSNNDVEDNDDNDDDDADDESDIDDQDKMNPGDKSSRAKHAHRVAERNRRRLLAMAVEELRRLIPGCPETASRLAIISQAVLFNEQLDNELQYLIYRKNALENAQARLNPQLQQRLPSPPTSQ